MPFKLKLKRSRQYNVSSKNLCVISVELLDNTTVECTLSSQSSGQECLSNVCQRLGLHQPQYFGLRFLAKKGTFWWVDLHRPLKKQLDKYAQEHSSLYLGVMYFVADVNILHDEVTRYHYFLQLKNDIIEGKLRCNEDQMILFASYSLQAEFGDHDPERHTSEYLTNFGLLPKPARGGKDHQESILEKVIRTHRSLQGLSQQLAEIYYIMEAQRLEGYGQECFVGKDNCSTAVFVCPSLKGISLRYISSQPSMSFKWTQILNLVHHKRCLGIEVRDHVKAIQIFLDDSHLAKYVWKTCIQQHQFYTKNEGTSISPKVHITLPKHPVIRKVSRKSSATSSIQNKNDNSAKMKESHDSLDGLGVYHTESGYGELTPQSPLFGQMVLSEERVPPKQQFMNCSTTLTSSTPALPAAYSHPVPLNTLRVSSSAIQLHTTEVVNPSLYHPLPTSQNFPLQNKAEIEARCLILPSYRQAPDYDTAVKLKYGVQSHSMNDVSPASPMIQPQPVTRQLEAYPMLSYHHVSPPQSYAQYKNYNDLSHLDISNEVSRDANDRSIAARHYENVPAPGIQPPIHTYSSPELASQSIMQDVTTEQMISNVHLLYQFKPPPPYPYKQSSSTPDLTKSHQPSLCTNSSPTYVIQRDTNVAVTALQDGFHPEIELQQANEVLHHYLPPPQFSVSAGFESGPVELEKCLSNSSNAQHIVTSSVIQKNTAIHTYENYKPGSGPVTIVERPACRITTEPAFSTVMTAQSTEVPYRTQQAVMIQPSTDCVHATKNPPTTTPAAEKVPPRKPANLALRDDSQAMGPMLVAAMNGLTLSQPDILNSIPNDNQFPVDPRIVALENRLSEGQVFMEFEHIIKKKPMADFATALMNENMNRNRFKDVFPYEENRVRLTPTSENKTGYINASHLSVAVGTTQRFYIAAQGPLPNTLYSFWQMIWEHHVSVVVMLTEVQEEGQDKCFPYWPQEDTKTLQIGEFQITRNFSMSSPTYITCSLTLCHITSHQQRCVWHIQYTDWPDHSCPQDLQGFIKFMSEVDAVRRHAISQLPQGRRAATPVVIHCSAGVGRSGVVILCDIMLYALDHNQPIDIPTVLTQLRLQRMLTVQTLAQYKFVYIVLIQYLRNSRLI